MVDEERASTTDGAPGATAQRAVLGIGVVVLVAISMINSATTSFGPLVAPLKLLIGLVHLVAIGAAAGSLLRLQRPAVLSVAQDALLGQVVCLAYVYFRSFVSNLFDLPGISTAEWFVAEALLVAMAWKLAGAQMRPRFAARGDAVSWGLVHFFWLAWLAGVATLKLDLYFTPSSDPDIHAFYAKTFLEHGRVYYDLLPNSDVSMVYPSAFASMNFVLAKLSGLHPVQVVNIAVYLQLTLFAGASFSVFASVLERRSSLIAQAALHFGFCYFAFNAVFVVHRMYLPGTPRLAHTALLLFPLLFVTQHREAIRARPGLFSVPLVALLVGICVNPSHAPATLLVGALSLALLWRVRSAPEGARPSRRSAWLLQGIVAACLAMVFLWTDPFYRSLAVQQLASVEEVEAATDLTGSAFGGPVEFATLLPRAIPAAIDGLAAAQDEESKRALVSVLFIIGVAFAISLLVLASLLGKKQVSKEENPLLRFAGAVLVLFLVHAVWAEVVPQLGKEGVLQTRLLIQYTHAMQQQISMMFFSVAPMMLVALLLVHFAAGSSEHGGRSVWLEHGVTITALVVSLPLFYTAQRANLSAHYDAMRRCPLGELYSSDVEFAQKVAERVNDDERVLLPGRSRRVPDEHWVLTTEVGRAIPLYSDVKTSFFLGLDGQSFTPGAYLAHVKPPNFDREWLRQKNVVWLVESGKFSPRILNRHYDRVFGNDRAVLWKLRE